MYQYLQRSNRENQTVKKSLQVFKISLLLALLLPAFKTQAQDFFPEQKDYGVSIGSDVELPGKNLNSYNKAVAYNLGFSRFMDRLTLGVNLSYREFNPKTPFVVEQIDPGHEQTTTYSTYCTFLFYLDGTYKVPFTEKINFYGGLNAGIGYNTSSVLYHDDNGDLYLGGGCKQIYVAPKLGASFALSNDVDLDVHAAYNLFAQTGNITNPTNTHVSATSFSSVMTGMGLVFKF